MTTAAVRQSARLPTSTKARRSTRRSASAVVERELDALYERPGFLLRRAHQIALSLFMEEVGAPGVTPGVTNTQFGAMVVLRARPSIDQATLARMVGIDRSTTGLVIGKLEAAGYVTRGEDGVDRRRKTLKLSAAGVAALRKLGPSASRASTRLLEPFNESDRRRFLDLLGRLVATYNGVVRTPLQRA